MRLTDIHCHLLPKVDDGPDSVAEAVGLLKEMHEEGVRCIIVTPHYRPDMFEASAERVWKHYLGMRKIAKALGIRLFLGCEYYRNSEIPELIEKKERPSMAGSEYVLIEFSPDDVFQTIRNHVYTLRSRGFKPIVAHVERYECCMNTEKIEELVELGAYIQMNAGSVLGRSGAKMKKYCKKLMEEDLVDFIASDTHDSKTRRPNLGKCAAYVEKKMGREYTERIFIQNPANILRNRRT